MLQIQKSSPKKQIKGKKAIKWQAMFLKQKHLFVAGLALSLLIFPIYTYLFSFQGVNKAEAANRLFTSSNVGCDGNFSTAACWSAVPAANDTLRINGTCIFDNAAANLAYGALNVGFSAAGSLVWPVGATNTLNVTTVSSTKAGSSIDMTNGGTLQVRTSWTTTNQTITTGAGTIVWNVTGGTSTLPAAITTYNNLTISSTTRLVSLAAATTLNGSLNISSITTSGGLTATASNFALNVKGDFINNATNAPGFTSGTGTVTLDGTGAQSVSGTRTTAFNNLTISKASGTATLAANITTAALLTVSAGTLDLSSFTANRATAGGTLTVSNGATLKIGGTNTFPTNYSTHTLGATSTVEYSGTAQAVTAESYGHLNFSGSGNKTTASGTTTVAGNWDITGPTALLSSNNSSYTVTGNITGTGAITSGSGTISVAGNWTNNGTFTKGTGTVIYNGGVTQTVGAVTYNNLTINKSGGSASLGGSGTVVDGVLTLTSGNITTAANDIYISSTGSVSRTGGQVVGNLRKYITTGATNKTFEIGDASNYTPMSVAFGIVNTAGDLTASTTSGDHPNIIDSTIDGTLSVNRYWSTTNSGIAFDNYIATFTFINPGDLDSGVNTSMLVVGKYNSGWTYPTVGTRTSTSTQATGLTSFSDFQLGHPKDTTPPTITPVSIASNNANTSKAKVGDVITLSFTADEALQTPTVTFLSGGNAITNSVTVSNPSGNNWTGTYTTSSSDTAGAVTFTISNIKDLAGNSVSNITTTTDSTSVTFDKTAANITPVSITSNNANTSRAKAGNLITLSFTANETIQTPTVAFLSGGNAITNSVTVSNPSGNNWTASYTASSSDTDGAVTFTISNIKDLANNATSNVTTTTDSTAVTFDKTAPTVSAACISVTGATGTSGAFKFGDTPLLKWRNDNPGSGCTNNNSDVASVSFNGANFRAGDTALAGANSSNIWSIGLSGAMDSQDDLNNNTTVTVTDTTGNVTVTPGTNNYTVDTIVPTVTDGSISISGASGTGGAYKTGDTVTATWNNTAGGDNNSDTISTVTVNFSDFGGGSAVSATNSTNTWTATYTVVAGSIDGTNKNVAVTSTDNAGNLTTTSDTTNATVDNIAPTVTDARISISGASGTGGAFKIGDTVTASWNNTAGGDNNSDTISAVTVNFSQFGGGASVSASNSSSTWTATYVIVAGAIDTTNRNVSVTATDNAGNTTTTADTTNATVDNIAPTVTDARISISGASGTGGAYKIGDTVTATWNNAAGGDNNLDTISTVRVNFNDFGGVVLVAASDSSNTWTATFLIVAGSIDGTNKNVAVTATDNAGNATTTSDTTNATVDNIAPTVTDANISISGASGIGGAYKIGDTVTATWNNTVGGENNADTISTVTVNFTQFGGGAAVSASNLAGVWTATYAIGAGSIEASNRNASVTATDNAGNVTTASDTTNATVDNSAPVVAQVTPVTTPTNDPTPNYTFSSTETGTIHYGGDCSSATTAATVGNNIVTFNTLSDGAHSNCTVSVTDGAGNSSNTQSVSSFTIDTAVPTVALTTTASNPTKDSPIPVTVTFSESVADFDLTDVTVSNGIKSNFAGTGTTYTFDLAPSGQGVVTADIDAAKAHDDAGNPNTAATQLSRTYDSVAPSVTITSTTTSSTNVSPIPVTVTFSEDVADFDSTDVTVANAILSNFAGTGTTYTFDLAPGGQVTVTVDIDANKAHDAAGNGNTAATRLSRTYDSISPAVNISSTAPSLTNTSPIPVSVVFSESVADFDLTDVTVSNGIKSNFAGSGTTYTFDIAPSGQGAVTADIDAAKAHDAAGNANTAATQLSRTYDSIAPSVTLSSTASATTNVSPIPVTVTFSESVADFDLTDVTVSNGIKSNFAGTGTTYTFDLAPSGQGVVTADIDAGKAHDAAGNGNTVATQLSRTYDSIAPSVTLSSTTTSSTNVSPIPVTVTFSESVADFDLTDVTVSNGIKSNFAGTGTTYTFDLAPSGQGVVTADVDANKAHDAAGNGNTAATQLSRTYDNIAPTVTLSTTATNPTDISPIPVTVTFNESVADFVIGDITVSNGIKSNFAGTGTTYTFDLAPSADGVVTVDVDANKAHDAAGNGNTAATQLSRIYDTAVPTVILSTTASNPTNASPIPVTATFSESVADFDLTDVTVSNGIKSNFAGSGTTYTFDVAPSGQGVVTVGIDAGKAHDLAGNGNTAATQLTRTYDSVVPTVTLSSTAASHTNVSPIPVTVTFSESVADFDLTDVTVSNGIKSNFAGTGTTYTFDLAPSGQGVVTADIDAAKAHDDAGNPNTAATQLSRTYDSIAPSVTLSSTTSPITNVSPIPVTATFSESVTGFILSDVTVSNGLRSNFAGSGTTYTFDVTPSGQGVVTIDIDADKASDDAGNGNTAATQLSRTYDSISPTVAQVTPVTTPTNDTTPDYTFSSTEAGTITYGGDCSSATPSAVSGSNIITFNALMEGSHSNCTIKVTDSATNQSNTLNVNTFLIDLGAPSVVISSTATGPTKNSPIPMTATFSEPVTGFVDTEVIVSNGVVGDFTPVSGSIYTFNVTPAGQGVVTVDINATVAHDAANNGNTAATQFTITYDSLAPASPVITSIAGDNQINNSEKAAIIVLGTAEANSLVSVTLSDGTNSKTSTEQLSGGATSFSITINGTTATPAALVDGTITPSVTARDEATNVSSATSTPTATQDATAPSLSSFTSSTADGAYGTGAIINITANYSEAPQAGSTITVVLDSGATIILTTISSNSLTADYTVLAGQNSTDLKVSSITSQSVSDSAGNTQSSTTLPATNIDTGSNIIVDTAAPTVVAVSSTASNGLYSTGQTIPITIQFNDIVNVTGFPQLTLETGSTDELVDYSAGSGTNTLTFNYLIASTDSSVDLDYHDTAALTLNGGTIKDNALNNAILTLVAPDAVGSLGGDKNLAINVDIPILNTVNIVSNNSNSTSAAKTGDTITLSFTASKDLQTPVVTISGHAVVPTGALASWTATYQMIAGDLEGLVAFTIDYQDLASNSGPQATTTTDSTAVTFDKSAPTLNGFSTTKPSGTYGPSTTIDVIATYAELLSPSSTMTVVLNNLVSMILNVVTGSTIKGTYTIGVTGSGESILSALKVNSITTESTFDTAGNQQNFSTVPGTNLDSTATVLVDTTAPATPTITLLDPINATNKTAVTITGTGEADAGLTYQITSSGGGVPVSGTSSVSGSGAISILGLDVTALGDGTLTAHVTLTDAYGNQGLTGTDTATKTTVTAPAPVGGGAAPSTATLTVGGTAFANAQVYILMNDAPLTDVPADANGLFIVTVPGLNGGSKTVSVYAISETGTITDTVTRTINLEGGKSASIGDIALSAETLKPLSEVQKTQESLAARSDINGDSQINIVDFSILAYWVSQPYAPKAAFADLNQDGKVDLIDFSIMAYYWGRK